MVQMISLKVNTRGGGIPKFDTGTQAILKFDTPTHHYLKTDTRHAIEATHDTCLFIFDK